ncbi:MAG: hypothetical protein K8S25_12600 [Alphaproteobacteria bacterium]|nr:hypothetical protein [Alphaproteobacteria bacterium]
MQIELLQTDPAIVVAAAVIGLGLLGLAAEAMLSSMRRGASAKSPIVVVADRKSHAAAAPVAAAAPAEVAQAIEVARETVAEAAAEPAPAKDTPEEQRRFFTTLGAGLNSNDEALPFALSALQANLSADVFMERMTLAAKGWRPDGFGTAGRKLLLKADGTPPDMVAEKVIEGYEQLKQGHVREALDAFLAGIEAAKSAAAADPNNAWPHAWSAFAWRGLALIAEESGDVQTTLAGLKVAYQSMVNAFEITTQLSAERLAEAA